MTIAIAAGDPSGTWTFAGFGGGGRGGGGGGGAAPGGAPPANAPMSTLVLTMKGGQLTGKLTAPGRGGAAGEPVDITAASFKDDMVTFSVERTGQDGTKRVTKYSGKLEGDTITGKSEGPGRDGAPQSRDWVAKKSKA